MTPIVIFAFNRPKMLKRLLDSLQNDVLFDQSGLYIFIDGPRNKTDEVKVEAVKQIAKGICDIKPTVRRMITAKQNQGLGNSIISGVSRIIQQYGKAIVLEDDLVCTPNFLSYMNQALDFYEQDERIISICGYGLKIKRPKDYVGDVYLSVRSSSWGWATWKNRWEKIDWEIKDWDKLSHDASLQKAFNQGGSDLYGMLKGYMEGKNHSWAIRFCYNQFRQGKYAICPFLSKIDNEGFGAEATNCKQSYSRFKCELDNTGETTFVFDKHLTYNEKIGKECYKYHSIPMRIYSKIRKILHI